jgi:hypothetical protein
VVVEQAAAAVGLLEVVGVVVEGAHLLPGLAIKKPTQKKPTKNPPSKNHKMFFLRVFGIFLIFHFL